MIDLNFRLRWTRAATLAGTFGLMTSASGCAAGARVGLLCRGLGRTSRIFAQDGSSDVGERWARPALFICMEYSIFCIDLNFYVHIIICINIQNESTVKGQIETRRTRRIRRELRGCERLSGEKRLLI